MNQRIWSLFFRYMSAVLIVAGCQSRTQKLVPVTGAEEISLPTRAELVRNNVLDYLLASSRLAGIPARADWQAETGSPTGGESRFRSGDWLMLIRAGEDGKQEVLLLNDVEQVFWSGYLRPDGGVVDTAYGR